MVIFRGTFEEAAVCAKSGSALPTRTPRKIAADLRINLESIISIGVWLGPFGMHAAAVRPQRLSAARGKKLGQLVEAMIL